MKSEYVETLKEMLKNWNQVFERIQEENPTMSEMEVHKATRIVINESIEIKG